MQYDLQALAQTQTTIEHNFKQILNLKLNIQQSIIEFSQQYYQNHQQKIQAIVIPHLLNKIIAIKDKYDILAQQIKRFKVFIIEVFLMGSKTFNKNRELDKQMIQKLSTDLTKQIKINNEMKNQVLQLNQLINEHIKMNNKKLSQKDQIIKNLKSKLQIYQIKSHSNQTISKDLQTQIYQFANSIHIIDNYQSQNLNHQCPHSKSKLSIINQQQQSIISNHPNPSLNISHQNSQNSIMDVLNQIPRNSLSKIQSSRKSNQKKKPKIFIQDFRRNMNIQINQINQELDKKIQSQMQNFSKSSSRSFLSIGRNDCANIIIPQQNISPRKKKKNFTKKSFQQEKTSNSFQNLQESKVKQSRMIFQKSYSGQRKSKQKIYVTQKQQLKESSMREKSRDRISEKDLNTPGTRPNSKQKLKLTTKTIIQSNKTKFINNYKLPHRKTFAQNSKKILKQYLQNIHLSIGQKKYQSRYQGKKVNGLKSGHGILEYFNGLVYKGQFRQNARHGRGQLLFNNTVIYDGEWQRDKMCGKGTLKNIHFINKSKGNENINMGNIQYIGQFQENKFHGQGTLYFSSNQKLIGRFNDGIPQGEYTYYNKSGQIEFAVWQFKQ